MSIVPRVAQVDAYSAGECQQRVVDTLGSHWPVNFSKQVCVSDVACQGDSGGPLIRMLEDGSNAANAAGYAVLEGICSWGSRNDCVPTLGQASFYTRTSFYRGWICSETGAASACSSPPQ